MLNNVTTGEGMIAFDIIMQSPLFPNMKFFFTVGLWLRNLKIILPMYGKLGLYIL